MLPVTLAVFLGRATVGSVESDVTAFPRHSRTGGRVHRARGTFFVVGCVDGMPVLHLFIAPAPALCSSMLHSCSVFARLDAPLRPLRCWPFVALCVRVLLRRACIFSLQHGQHHGCHRLLLSFDFLTCRRSAEGMCSQPVLPLKLGIT